MSYENTKKLAYKGSRNLFIGQIVMTLISFLGNIFLVRILGKELFGLYMIVFSFYLVIKGFMEFGLSYYIIRKPSEITNDELSFIFFTYQIIGVITSGILFFIFAPFCTSWFGYPELFPLFTALGIGSYFLSWFFIPFSLFEKKMDYWKSIFLEFVEIVSFYIVFLLGIVFSEKIKGLQMGIIIRCVTMALVAYSISPINIRSLIKMPHNFKQTARSILYFTMPVWLSGFAPWLITIAPSILVGKLAGPSTLAVVQLGNSLIGYPQRFTGIATRVGYSWYSKIQHNIENLNAVTNKTIHTLLLIIIPLTMGIASLSPFFIPILYGSEWFQTSEVMLFASVPMIILSVFSVQVQPILAKGASKEYFIYHLIHVILYWIFGYIAVLYFQHIGIPIAHFFTLIFSGILLEYYYKKLCGSPRIFKISSPIIIGAIITIICWNLSKTPFWWLSLMIIFTLTSIWYMKSEYVMLIYKEIRATL